MNVKRMTFVMLLVIALAALITGHAVAVGNDAPRCGTGNRGHPARCVKQTKTPKPTRTPKPTKTATPAPTAQCTVAPNEPDTCNAPVDNGGSIQPAEPDTPGLLGSNNPVAPTPAP